jgi:uncharacterized protein (TIGR03083 family)
MSLRVHGSKEFWLAGLRAESAAFLAAVSEPDALTRQVPSCPGWTVGELTRHLGGVYDRIRRHAGVTGADERWPALAVPEQAPAANDPSVLSWFREQVTGIERHLESLDPDAPTYNWAPRPRVASFWQRRAAHETAVHRWDAQLAIRLPEPIESKLAGDTVAEAMDTFLPAGRHRQDPATYGLVHLFATDLGVHWYIRLRGTGMSLLDTDTLLDDDPKQPRASVMATASDLALAVWGRVPFTVGATSGQPDLLDAVKIC